MSHTQTSPITQIRLGEGRRGLRGTVARVGNPSEASGAPRSAFDIELEKRLLEIGLVEGARVEILHEGFIGRDPIAVQVDSMRVALRRREANSVLVTCAQGAAATGGPALDGPQANGPMLAAE